MGWRYNALSKVNKSIFQRYLSYLLKIYYFSNVNFYLNKFNKEFVITTELR